MIDLENDKVNNLKRKLFKWLYSKTQFYNWRTLCESIRYIIFYVLFVSVTTALAFTTSCCRSCSASRRVSWRKNWTTGSRLWTRHTWYDAWTTQPAHFIQNCPVGLTEVYWDITQSLCTRRRLLCHFIMTRKHSEPPLNINNETWSMKVKIWDIVLGYCIFYQWSLNSDNYELLNWLSVELLGYCSKLPFSEASHWSLMRFQLVIF